MFFELRFTSEMITLYIRKEEVKRKSNIVGELFVAMQATIRFFTFLAVTENACKPPEVVKNVPEFYTYLYISALKKSVKKERVKMWFTSYKIFILRFGCFKSENVRFFHSELFFCSFWRYEKLMW